jgi:cation diffusion facilitator CzcD-associated flavoprotein CzcO
LEARWEGARRQWVLTTTRGRFEADVLLTACGQLNRPSVPAIPGLSTFAGPVFHTAEWREDVDLTDRRVALIGTGCSAIQVGPSIQPLVRSLAIYQRSPGWTFPRMDYEYSERAKRLFERFPALQRLDRASILAFHELGAAAMTNQRWLLPAFRAIGRRQINRAIKDPALRRKVTPRDEIGCKRVMVTDDWYPSLTKPNVELVTDAIDAVTATGVRTADGRERATDVIVLATGFRTHGFVAPMEIFGAHGRALSEEWSEVPRAYLGLTVPGFPNLFLIYGPNTNGGTGSVIYTIEAGMGHVLAALRVMEQRGARAIEVRREAAEEFDRELRAALNETVWHTGCTSWYLDENGNDPNQWPWRWTTYRRRAQELPPEAYALQ